MMMKGYLSATRKSILVLYIQPNLPLMLTNTIFNRWCDLVRRLIGKKTLRDEGRRMRLVMDGKVQDWRRSC